MATTQVRLYKSDGSTFTDNGLLVASHWNIVEGKPSTYTPTAHKHVKADITDFAHNHDDRYYTESEVNTKLAGKTTYIKLNGQLQISSYRRSVIALCELTNTNPNFNSYSIGTLTFHRSNGLESAVKFDFAIEKRHDIEGYNISYLTLAKVSFANGITPCIFTYNGVKYGGIEIFFADAELSYIDFYGVTNFNIFGLDYYNQQTSTALVDEVNNSLSYDTNLIIISEGLSSNKKRVILEGDARLSDSRTPKDHTHSQYAPIDSPAFTGTPKIAGVEIATIENIPTTASEVNARANTWVPTWNEVTGKPTFATVATSGNYNDLSNKPSIPTIPSVMSVSEGTTGTSTTQRTINAYNLKSIIDSSITTLANTIAIDYATEDDLISHASTKGTTSVYGHVRLINNLTTSSYSNGDALSAYQGYVLNSALNNKLSTSDTAYNSTRYNGYQMRIGSFSSGASGYITFSYD